MLNEGLEGDEHQGNFRFLEREDKTGSGQLGSDSVTSQHLNKRIFIQLTFDPLGCRNMFDYLLFFHKEGLVLSETWNGAACNSVKGEVNNFFPVKYFLLTQFSVSKT